MQTWDAGVGGGRVAGVAPTACSGGCRRPHPRRTVAPRDADEEARIGGGGVGGPPGRRRPHPRRSGGPWPHAASARRRGRRSWPTWDVRVGGSCVVGGGARGLPGRSKAAASLLSERRTMVRPTPARRWDGARGPPRMPEWWWQGSLAPGKSGVSSRAGFFRFQKTRAGGIELREGHTHCKPTLLKRRMFLFYSL